MKKGFILSLLAVIALYFDSYAATVTVVDAKKIAGNFFKVSKAGITETPTAELVYTRTENGTNLFYVFNITPAPGFVIVSADDAATPVIGYSFEASFDATNITQSGLSNWMNKSAAKIAQAVTNHLQADAQITGQWQAYAQGINPVAASRATTVDPLVTTRWNQDPYYNNLCPFNSADNQRAVTGCVATSMAQIMKYWNYPATGKGNYSYTSGGYGVQSADFESTSYDWAHMAVAITGINAAPVALLMYHCGVSVAMNYGDMNEGGSGANVLADETWGGGPSAQSAFVDNFRYDPNTIHGLHKYGHSSTWINSLKAELDAGRPMLYEGWDQTAGGHAWVCDGYDANNYLHMNWGWGGSANGYFASGALTVAGDDFSSGEAVLMGIQPIQPMLSASVSKPSLCSGESTTLTATAAAGTHFTWTPATGLSCASCATTTASPQTTTTYTVTIDSAGYTAIKIITINVRPGVSLGIVDLTPSTCYGGNDGAADLLANGGTPPYVYTWSNGATTLDATGLAADHYRVTVADAGGCSAASTIIIGQGSKIVVTPSITDATSCNAATGGANLAVTGGSGTGYTYNWDNGSTAAQVNNLRNGSYNVTVTDSKNCSTVSEVFIGGPYQIEVTTEVVNATAGNNGAINIEAINQGTAPYSYSWSNGQSTQDITGLAPGVYNVTVTDNNGCNETASITVNQATGINNVADVFNFSVYPNPSHGVVNVQLGKVNGNTTITLENVLGQAMFTKNVTELQSQLDLSSFPSGVYLLEVRQGDKRHVKQIVLNR